MPAELKTKWLEALRSGEYKQGRGFLYHPATDSYCCLGVLKEVSDGDLKKTFRSVYREGGCLPTVPTSDWYETHGIKGFKSVIPGYWSGEQALTSMNDGLVSVNRADSKSFSEIADWIEENVEGYDSASVKQ